MRGLASLFALILLLAGTALPAAAQVVPRAATPEPVTMRLPGNRTETLELRAHRGYPAFAVSALGVLGWEARANGDAVVITHRTGLRLRAREGSPWLQWEDRLLQMAHEVYSFGDAVMVPLQLIADFFPGLLPAAYRYDEATRTLFVEGAVEAAAGARTAPATPLGPAAPGERAPASRLVVIDAGHGGDEPGAVGPGGTHEKAVALAIALALAEELGSDPWIEVRLTRDRDTTVPIWDRGDHATEWRAERPAVFISIHANAVGRPEVRGFETFFLSEARTEHERRVAAAENAPLRRESGDGIARAFEDPLLAGILRDLITHDHQNWSALLAETVQRELATFHPGPDRGVKQGPFAVLTNALMPSVLVEIGFITNREEERLLARPDFQRDSARAIARAVRAFFDRYPPGGTG